jgi:hypothetical protein
MAGDWLKIEVCLPDKPEVWHMHETTGIDPDAIVGKLIRVWAWFDSQTQDGNACFVSEALIDKLAGVEGFAYAMQAAGWLEIDGPEIRLPNFARHNGKTAKDRALTAKRVANHKARTNANGNAEGNEPLTITPLPREEKRREERKSKSTVQPSASRFDDWYSIYPSKKGKEPARKAWIRDKLDATADDLITHTKLMIAYDDSWRRGFVPMASTYLNQRRWEDEPSKPPTASNGRAEVIQLHKSPKEAMKPSETPLERDIARAKQDCHFGIIDAAERDRRILAATNKHRGQK